MNLGVVGLNLDGPLVTVLRVREAVLAGKSQPEVPVSIYIVRLEAEAVGEAGDGVVELAQAGEHVTEVVVRFGEMGIETKGLAATGSGFIEPALLSESGAQVVV